MKMEWWIKSRRLYLKIMMKNRSIVAVGLIGLFMLTGCTADNVETLQESSQSLSLNQDNIQEDKNTDNSVQTESDTLKPGINEEADKAKEEADQKAKQVDEEVKTVLDLKVLVGEKSDKVRQVLGTPKETQNLEETKILLSDKFVKEVIGQKISIEVVYDDEEAKVNFINIKCVKTDNVASFVAKFESELIKSFGEGTIEKITDVRGTKRKEWDDETLTYALSHIENDVTLEIYPIHE